MKAVLTTLVLATLAAASHAGEAKTVAAFKLKDTAGNPWALQDAREAKAVVVVFLGTECPINNAYLPRLNELAAEAKARGAVLVGINANEHDTAEAIAEHAKKYQIAFPVLRDEKHLVADRFGAERVPEAFVLDAARVIRYQGRIDDQFGIGYRRDQPRQKDLVRALEEVLEGKPVTQPRVPVAGCFITRAPRPKTEATVTYTRHVARILQAHCQDCHRPGQIGPMPLLTYDDASAWAQMIDEVVRDQRMPPWHADPRHGKFVNDRRLIAADRETLLAWIAQGCPRGDEADAPAPRKFADTWSIGTPDAVFTMPRDYKVAAKAPKGGVPYQYFIVPTRFDEDRWVQAVEARPGNRAVVHHILIYALAGDKKRITDVQDGIGNSILVTYAPGDVATTFPPGAAKKIPKGGVLVFQMHYTPNGTEQTDRSSVALVFSKEPPRHEVRTRGIAQQLLFIPPNSDNYAVRSASTFKKDAVLFSFFPHMHLRGKDFEYQAVYPDGRREVLLSVPRYDFGWQGKYELAQPMRVPAGTKIECLAHFDNSAKNLSNPNPAEWVHWGDQTWQEMMIGFVDYAYAEP